MNKNPLLKVSELSIGVAREGRILPITDKVSFEVGEGEVFGLVGESGCGKTLTGMSALGFLPMPGGRLLHGGVSFQNREIFSLSSKEIHAIRGAEIAVIFQEPTSALNPLQTVSRQMREIFNYHPFRGNPEKRVQECLEKVGMKDISRVLKSYPHELSGGMLQRVIIALALLMKPKLLIADEPTTALDVTIQAQIMELLLDLQKDQGLSILFITHNLNLIAQYAHNLAVMYAGRIAELGSVENFFTNPCHPYSQGLLAAIPSLETEKGSLVPISGQVPSPEQFSTGCRFRDRCPKAFSKCLDMPSLKDVGPAHRVSCFLMDESR